MTTSEAVPPANLAAAERITLRISLKLDSMAESYSTVMPLIREAVESEAWRALGYSGVSAWAEDRFSGALRKLGVETRREVVHELTAAGMSTRAIAPVVGVSQQQVAKDRRQVTPQASPEPVAKITETTKTETYVDTQTGEVVAPPTKITGLDGKAYRKPEYKPETMAALREFLDDDEMRDSAWRVYLTKSLSKAHALARVPLDRVASASEADLDESVEMTVNAITEWHAKYKRARRQLRSVQ